MTLKHLFLKISCLLIRQHILNCAINQSELGNAAVIYNFSTKNINKSLPNKSYTLNDVHNIADLYYDFSLLNNLLGKQTTTINATDLNNFPLALFGNKTANNEIHDQTCSNLTEHAVISNIADLNNFTLKNESFKHQNKNISLAPNLNATKTLSISKNPLLAGNIAELYQFSLPTPTVMGMFNCSYENTINITGNSVLPNGSYIYDNHTIIPPDLVGNYDYEILYDGSKRKVPQHKRACICRLKQCLTLCSNSIIDFYQDVVNDDEVDDDFMNLFSIKMTLSNKTVVTRNIVKDFEHIVLDEFCVPFYTLSPEKNEKLGWTLFENGTLLRHSDHMQLKNIEYCFELYQDVIENNTYYLINPLNCAKKRDDLELLDEFKYWTQVFSIPFFLLTIIAYFCLPDLRNIHGDCFMTYLSGLTISYSLLSYINLSKSTFDPIPCLLLGYLSYYMQLSHYTWLGIICIDTWKSFNDYGYKASYQKYATYGYPLPLLLTFFTFVAQNSKINDDLKPGISEYRCGLEVNKWAASIYLYGPCLVILVVCFISFILISRIIKTNDRELHKVKELHFECPKARYTLYLRLFLMMGLSWILDVISYLLNMFSMTNLSEIIDYINALQGLYIFVNFIGRKRIRNLIRERFCNTQNVKCPK